MGTSNEIEVAIWSLLTKRSLEIYKEIDILIMTAKKRIKKYNDYNAPLFCRQNRLNLFLFFNSMFLSSSSELLELADYATMQNKKQFLICKRRFRWQTDDLMESDIDCSAVPIQRIKRACLTLSRQHYITLDFLFFVLRDFRSITEQHY